LRWALPALLLFALLLAPPIARAQRGSPGPPDEVDLALGWARGRFHSPVICTFAGEPRTGLRRVEIGPGPAHSTRRVDLLTFVDLEARDAERCRTTLGGDSPNLIGSLWIAYTPKRPHSDTPDRDFKLVLRDGDVPFEIVRGRVRSGPPQLAPEALEEIDLRGGTVRIEPVRVGSDAARVLAEFGSKRKLELTVEGPDGILFRMPLVALGR